MASAPDTPYSVRDFRPNDAEACRRLYTDALLTSALADNDTGWDIDNLDDVYMKRPGGHFWVAVTNTDEVVGMIGVQHHESGVGEIRRFRVAPEHRHKGLGTLLLDTALGFCQACADVKLTLDTVIDKNVAIALFKKFSFKYHSSKQVGEKETMYFYLDLYTSEKEPKKDNKD